MTFYNISLKTLSQATQLILIKKIISYVPFTIPSEKPCLINHILSPSREEIISLPKAKQREWSDSFKVMQKIPDRAMTRTSTFQLRTCCGLNLVPAMPLPDINHCLSHAGFFFPCRWPYIFSHDQAFPSTAWCL